MDFVLDYCTMRNFLLAIVFLSSAFIVKGQTSVKINVVLNHIQNLTVNPTQETVSLVYNTVDDYKKGVESVQKEHLNVFSTGAFVVKVKVANEDFVQIGSDAAGRIRLPNVGVTAKAVDPITGVNTESRMLGINETALITGENPILNQKFDVTYKGPGDNELILYSEMGKTNIFTNTVMYSIEAK